MRVPSSGVVPGVSETSSEVRPWAALWALVIGFFMILVDTTIVSVANPAIMRGLGADISGVLWVTSAYLLSYAVPLLVTGRLGDRFGPRRVYLAGLVVFTVSSALCGLSPTIGTLVAARAVQGLGAALMTPQTMAVITRIFPPTGRGQAMSLWGATAAIATLVGPVLGGFLVDGLGWEWIFFVNVPVGVVAFVLAHRFVPRLETHHHRFDLAGVALSAVGLFLLVFGIQEGQTFHWGTIVGPITVWELILAGVVVLGLFVFQQARTANEPLLPLRLFKVRNFTLANSAIAMVGLAVTSSSLPLVFYYQLVLGFSPTRAALQLIPMAAMNFVLAPVVGRLVDRVQRGLLAAIGMSLMAASLLWYSLWLTPDASLWWRLLFPSALMGIASSFTWSPISSTATHDLSPRDAGAGSGVYNTVRQVGSVLGSAAIAATIAARLAANLPGGGSETPNLGAGTLPEFLHAGFSASMSQALLVPAAAAAIGAVVSACFRSHAQAPVNSAEATPALAGERMP